MNNVQSARNYGLRNTPVVVENVPNNVRSINFKAGEDQFVRQDRDGRQTRPAILQQQQRMVQQDPMIRMMEQQQKEQKKAKRKQNLSWGLGIAVSVAFLAVLLPQIFRKGGSDSIRTTLEKNATTLSPVDVTKKKPRHRDCYSDEVKGFIDRLEGLLTRKDIEAKGGKRITQVQFLGPGGTGKTDSAEEVARKVIEKFPGSEYYVPDLSMLSSSSFKGQDVQMLTEYTQAIGARAKVLQEEGAKAGKKKYIVMFLDEYDKIAMKDNSHNMHDSNKTTGALKTLINELKKHDNVILLSATNYPQHIEGAIDSRMAEKVLFDYLTPIQIITSITEHYKNKPELISKELLDAKNPKLKEICSILGKKEHEMEYRKIFDNILPKTLLNSPDGKSIELKHFVDAILEPGNVRTFNITPEEISRLKSIVA